RLRPHPCKNQPQKKLRPKGGIFLFFTITKKRRRLASPQAFARKFFINRIHFLFQVSAKACLWPGGTANVF
ncbi:hypothetical protein, partial [Akkermansia massiliensis]